VKPHTAFHGSTESGLFKMCAVGLGKHAGAAEIHRFGTRGLRELIQPTAGRIIEKGRVIGGLAVAENACEKTALLAALTAEAFAQEEPRILDWARKHMPSLPVERLDVLVIEEFGKHISGTGMDVNIIGRMRIPGEPEPEKPRIGSIVLLDRPEKAQGNASGMGIADVITRKFFDRIDFEATYRNVLTHGFFERGKVPLIAETEAQALAWALRHAGLPGEAESGAGDTGSGTGMPRVIRIRNTLVLDEMWVSDGVLADIAGRRNIEITAHTVHID